jgi:hypothetical protein
VTVATRIYLASILSLGFSHCTEQSQVASQRMTGTAEENIENEVQVGEQTEDQPDPVTSSPIDPANVGAATEAAAAEALTTLALRSDLLDGFVNLQEHNNPAELLTGLSTEEFILIQYAVIADSIACDGAVQFSVDLPSMADPLLANAGTYKICIAFHKSESLIAYGASAGFVIDFTAPAFESVALVNAAADGLINSSEHLQHQAMLGNIEGSDISEAKYKLVPSASNCDEQLEYGIDIPASDSSDFAMDGGYKICLRLQDIAGNVSYAVSGGIALFRVSPTALLSGTPTGTNLVVSPDITVSGIDVSHYRYKVGLAAETDCGIVTAYSVEQATAIHITTSLSAIGDGVLKICVVGRNSEGNWQALDSATSATWTKDTTAPVFSSLALANAALDGIVTGTERALTTALGEHCLPVARPPANIDWSQA